MAKWIKYCGVPPKSRISERASIARQLLSNCFPYNKEQWIQGCLGGNCQHDIAYIDRRYHGNQGQSYCSSRCNEYPSRRYLLVRVEAGSNTSTVTQRVVGGDEKGSLESEIVKYGHVSYGTRTWKWLLWRGPAAIVNDKPVLSSESAPYQKTRNYLTVIKIWS
jgi:hypothetical protein